MKSFGKYECQECHKVFELTSENAVKSGRWIQGRCPRCLSKKIQPAKPKPAPKPPSEVDTLMKKMGYKLKESRMGDLAIEIDDMAELVGKNPKKIAIELHKKKEYSKAPIEVLEKFAKDWLSNPKTEDAAGAMGGFGPQSKSKNKDVAVGGMMEKRVKEGVFKPGERSTMKRCPRCKGKGTTALTTTAAVSPCKVCKGSGKVFTGDAAPPFREQYYTVRYLRERCKLAIEEFKQHVFDAAKWEGMTEEEERDIHDHIWNMPPEKLMSIGKNKTELRKRQGGNPALPEEAEQMYCPKCKINVTPEPSDASHGWKNACPQCGSKLDPKLKDEWSEEGSVTHYNGQFEDSTVAGIAGFNTPMGTKGLKTGQIKDSKPINFRESKMQLTKIINEIDDPDDNPGHGTFKWDKPGKDLSTVPKTLTSLISKLSKSGELQKQMGAGYDKDTFLEWLKSKAAASGSSISDAYWDKLEGELTGNVKKDMFTIYNKFTAGAGLRAPR